MVRCITICLVHPGTCWTRCCQLVQCWAPPWCPSVVLFIRGSLSSLCVFQAQCDKLTSRSSDDCSFLLICSRANSGRQASQPFLGYLEVLFLLAGGESSIYLCLEFSRKRRLSCKIYKRPKRRSWWDCSFPSSSLAWLAGSTPVIMWGSGAQTSQDLQPRFLQLSCLDKKEEEKPTFHVNLLLPISLTSFPH